MFDGITWIVLYLIGGIINLVILIVVLNWLWMIKNNTRETADHTKSTAEYTFLIYQKILVLLGKEEKNKGAYIKGYFPYAEHQYTKPTPEENQQTSNMRKTFRKGLYDQAIADCTQALEINPRFAEAYCNRGIAYGRKGLYDQAIADYNKALEINPRFAEAYCNRGIAYSDKGLYDQAIADYTQALEINPRWFAEAYYNRGNAYISKGLYDQAIADYTQALEINPGDAEAYCNRGLAYGREGLYDQAIADYTQAIKINPGYADAYYGKATVCL